jgi:hypothetical protein
MATKTGPTGPVSGEQPKLLGVVLDIGAAIEAFVPATAAGLDWVGLHAGGRIHGGATANQGSGGEGVGDFHRVGFLLLSRFGP